MKFKIPFFIFFIGKFSILFSQIPILNSYPGITSKVIYLDFDGQVVSGTSWNGGNTINALPSTVSAANMRLIWQRISEDYRPFEVNVTTDSMRFNNAPSNKRIRVIFTPTSAWYGSAGGVAFLNSFTWGGYPGTPCWIFEDQLGYNSKNMGEAGSHEAGHSFSLNHQSTYNASCVKTEYNPGVGNGVTSWAPIMGVGYSKNVTLWHNGKCSTGCYTNQYDLSGNFNGGLTGNGLLTVFPDDVGDTFGNSKLLNLSSQNLSDSGLISTTTDIDMYNFTICNSRYVSIAVKPWALDTNATGYSGANLDVKFKLFNSSNVLIAADSNINKLNTNVGLTLNAGTYYFSIDGDASAYYTDYGSLGKYYIKIKALNPPAMSNTILPYNNLCAGQSATLNFSSNGIPTSWQWTVSGVNTTTYNSSNPVYNFGNAGIYTLSLLAGSTASPGCITVSTLNVGSIPNISIVPSSSVICPQKTGTLTASGATTYTWLPGNFSGSFQIISPVANSSYTVLGSNGTCSNSATTLISLSPNFTLSVQKNPPVLCPGNTSTITPFGGTSYTLIPGGITNYPFLVSPTQNKTYTINGSDGSCNKSTSILISVSPSFSIGTTVSDSLPCLNQPITFYPFGGITYTVNPGGITGNPLVTNATATITTYTITGSDINSCEADTTQNIYVQGCNYLGIEKRNASDEFLIFPNPAKTELFFESSIEKADLRFTNVLGELVFERKNFDLKCSLKIDFLAKGIYFLNIETQKGNKIVKVIKE